MKNIIDTRLISLSCKKQIPIGKKNTVGTKIGYLPKGKVLCKKDSFCNITYNRENVKTF